MKPANEYKKWEGPYSEKALRNLKLSDSTKIWYPKLCPEGKTNPRECNHLPITFKELKKTEWWPSYGIYVHKRNFIPLVVGISFIITITITIKIFFSLDVTVNSEPLKPSKKKGNETAKDTGTVVLDTPVHASKCENCPCNCESEVIPGVTPDGKKALFLAVFLTKEKIWKFENEKYLDDGSPLKETLISNVPNFTNYEESTGLIAVGVSSQEHIDTLDEVFRAEKRADAILFTLRRIVKGTQKKLYKLNLGIHKEIPRLTKSTTGYQRRVIVISILKRDENMSTEDLGLALKNAFNHSEELKFDTNSYSNFSLTP